MLNCSCKHINFHSFVIFYKVPSLLFADAVLKKQFYFKIIKLLSSVQLRSLVGCCKSAPILLLTYQLENVQVAPLQRIPFRLVEIIAKEGSGEEEEGAGKQDEKHITEAGREVRVAEKGKVAVLRRKKNIWKNIWKNKVWKNNIWMKKFDKKCLKNITFKICTPLSTWI